MPNASTFAVAQQFGGNSGQGATSTDEFQFADGQSTAVRLQLLLPPLSVTGSRPFKVKAGGRITSGASTNFTVRLDHGKSSTIGSNTTIEASATQAVNTDSAAWHIEAILQTDVDEGDLHGLGYSILNSAITTWAVIDNFPTSVDPTAEIPFTVTGQFSGSNASNVAICDYFEAESL
jgi:hypothetical protein